MASKCHTDKYRRRRAKEIENKGQRVIREREREAHWAQITRQNRLRIEEAEVWAERTRWEYWRQDPERYKLLQRLVNILNYKLQNSPTYRLIRLSQIMGRLWR